MFQIPLHQLANLLQHPGLDLLLGNNGALADGIAFADIAPAGIVGGLDLRSVTALPAFGGGVALPVVAAAEVGF
jgi:hypothetical protein